MLVDHREFWNGVLHLITQTLVRAQAIAITAFTCKHTAGQEVSERPHIYVLGIAEDS